MFQTKLALLKEQLTQAYSGLIGGYVEQRYPEHLYSGTFSLEDSRHLLDNDVYLNFLCNEAEHLLMAEPPTIVDFSDDLRHVSHEVIRRGSYEAFEEIVTEEYLNGDDIMLPFANMLLYCGAVETPSLAVLEDMLVHVQDVTSDVRFHVAGRVRTVMMTVFHTVVDYDVNNQAHRHYSLIAPPMIIDVMGEGVNKHSITKFDSEAMKLFYGRNWGKVDPQTYETNCAQLATFVVGTFLFLYKHRKIEYREGPTPKFLNRKRKKKGKAPYERYYVSKLGSETRTIYTRSAPSDDPVRGKALHIRKGHWRLKHGHRKLAPNKQERQWIAATVVGDPQYGIIIRDYTTDMVDENELQDKLRESERGI